MQRYFISNTEFIEKKLNVEKSNHILKVLRMNDKEKVIVCYMNISYICEIYNSNSLVRFEIIEKNSILKRKINITIGHGIPKFSKFEMIIQKCSELNATKIIPLKMDRSIVKLDHKEEKKLARWNKIALEACEQSHRNDLLIVSEIIKLNEINFSEYDCLIVAYENAIIENNIKKILNCSFSNILIVIGPEGGISPEEIKFLKNNKFNVCSLGENIFRTETASLFILSAIIYEKELFL